MEKSPYRIKRDSVSGYIKEKKYGNKELISQAENIKIKMEALTKTNDKYSTMVPNEIKQ